MRIEPFIIAILVGISSCERTEPVSEKPEPPPEIPAAPGNPSLSAAQLALAKNHLDQREYAQALPYLQAAASPEAKGILSQTLASATFTIPSVLLRHPYPVLCFEENPGKAIFVALGGKHPTVVRWDISGTPEVTAVLFPTNASGIPHISLSQDGLHLLVHRGLSNLLCNANTLKPIANLGEFPADLDPDRCQPFTENGLLVAHPTKPENGRYSWLIRDSATGQILRSESFTQYPRPVSAHFDATTLCVNLGGDREIHVPLQGQTVTMDARKFSRSDTIANSTSMIADEFSIALTLTIPKPAKQPLTSSLVSAISGYQLDPSTQTLSEIPAPNRLDALSKAFPGKLPPTLKLNSAEAALADRLASAYPEEFPEISNTDVALAENIRKTFAKGDPAAIGAAIDSAEHGLPLATALFLALESENPSYIDRVAAKATDMPAALRALVDKGASVIPDPTILRLEQDWLGYESPDFSPIFLEASGRKSGELSTLSLPANPTEDDIESLTLKLLDPQTESDLGRRAIAESAIIAATSLAVVPEKGIQALRFSAIAQRYGANQALCLRTNATAFTSAGDFTSAHRTWIDLITNQPEADHLASDYSEAAYTAFETGDTRQAMEILNTGLFRFQNDVAFAIRAGWISLLTDHPSEALTYLSHATKLGLPPAEVENSTALLAIIHSQLGDPETASGYLIQLKAISPKWEDAGNIDLLPWPESLKATLKEIISRQPETEPEPLPESDPTHTAPRSGEFPIPEPPLPSR